MPVNDSDLNKITLTKHAEMRMEERVKVKKEKMRRMATKAWLSKLEIPKVSEMSYRRKFSEDGVFFRFFNGFIFVFKRKEDNPKCDKYLLITVLPFTKILKF